MSRAIAPPLEAARRPRHLQLQAFRVVVRVERRVLGVSVLLLVAILALGLVALLLGDYSISARDVLSLLAGVDTNDPLAAFFVRDVRAPRVVAAVAVGGALAISGAIFQSLSSNPLGSPDIIGFTAGAASGALLQIIVADAGPDQVAIGALLGGVVTAVTVYGLSYQRGVTGTRLVLVGVGMAAVLQAMNSVLVVKASLSAAQTATVWLAGSLNAMTWSRTVVLLAALAALFPAAALLARPLGELTLGDETAAAHGVRVERVRAGLVAVGVALVAVAVATAGPIAFVALAAPQLARRLTRSSGPGVGAAALMGAALLLASDVVAQRALAPTQLPVGVVTGAFGGAYLVWLLAWQWRRQRG